jgi:hypothetical protein
MEASHSWLKGIETGFKQECDCLWWTLKRDISSLTPLPTQPPPPITCFFPYSFSLIGSLSSAFISHIVSPLLPSLVPSVLKMETVCFSECWHWPMKLHGTKPKTTTLSLMTFAHALMLMVLSWYCTIKKEALYCKVVVCNIISWLCVCVRARKYFFRFLCHIQYKYSLFAQMYV